MEFTLKKVTNVETKKTYLINKDSINLLEDKKETIEEDDFKELL